MLITFLTSAGIIFIAEMGDKTQFVAFNLAGEFKRPFVILAGILIATLLNHTLASYLGRWISLRLSSQSLLIGLSILFFILGTWSLRPDQHSKENSKKRKRGAFLTSSFVFFLAEMGDKTQIATFSLAAKYQSPVFVICGTTTGMLLADGLAVFLGTQFSDKIPFQTMRRITAFSFFLFGFLELSKLMK